MTIGEMLEQMKDYQSQEGTEWTLSVNGALRCMHKGEACCPITWLHAMRNPKQAVPTIGDYRGVGHEMGLSNDDIQAITYAADHHKSNLTLRNGLRNAVGVQQ